MNCDCIKEIKDAMREHWTGRAGEVMDVIIEGEALVLAEKSYTTLHMPIRIKGTKHGYNTQKGKETFVVCNFCPICGAKIAPPDADPALPSYQVGSRK